jgi:gamma-glutamylcyclotransferase (GGCT)/AIG2-like uncharacterized protein YtfP
MNLFTYGSLMFHPVWSTVVAGEYASTAAHVSGYIRRKIKGETYPAVVVGNSVETLEGRLYLDVGTEDIVRLDEFEGEFYRREEVMVTQADGNEIKAAIYVLKNRYRYLLSDEAWDLYRFEHNELEWFLAN